MQWERWTAWRLFGLLAAGRLDAGIIYYVGLVVVVVAMVGALIAFYRTWVEINEQEEPDTPQDLLASFREAHAAGQIDDGEMERVRRLLAADGLGPSGRDTPRDRPEADPVGNPGRGTDEGRNVVGPDGGRT